MNFWPCYRGSGGRITYIASDWREVRVRLALSWRTTNYVRAIFGGSLYAAVDPVYMLMLMKILGPGYVVWDKSAGIRFRKPGRTVLTATFRLDEVELETIRTLLDASPKIDRTYQVLLVDATGTVHTEVEKVIQIRKK